MIYLIPTEVIPDEGQVVSNVEGPVLVEERELTTASRSAGEPDHHGVLALLHPRFKEEVEQPAEHQQATWSVLPNRAP